jgi:hypothetical protein
MARYARSARQVVVVVDVAIGARARWDRVQAREWEAGAVVVEGGIQP